MSKVTYTDQQKNAINGRGHSLLVSAAAGSGKTAVLVQRVLKYLVESKGEICRLMITTFTDAAAGELKDKLRAAIEAYLEENGGNDHLLMQSTLIDCAEIGTVHSICNSLILRHFDQLKLDPRCRVIDEADENAIIDEEIAAVLEELYGSADPAEQRFLKVYSVGRDDEKLTDLLRSGTKFLEEQPLAQSYINRTLSFYETAGKGLFECFPDDGLYQYIMQDLQEYADQYRFMLHRLEKVPELAVYPALFDFLEQEYLSILALKTVLDQRDYTAWLAAAEGFTFETLKWKDITKEKVEKEVKDLCVNPRQAFKDKFKGTPSNKGFLLEFSATEAEELARLAEQGKLLRTYFDLCMKVQERVKKQRRRMACINYNEMEQLAIELLVKDYDVDTDTLIPTEVALRLREDYDEIIVDEFQDTNRAQDLIFRALSKDETNLFMVGDLKQSIYRFRGAEPEIFDQKRQNSTPFTTETLTAPTVLELNSNFRSHPGVLRFCNRVFESIMSPELGGVVYDARERLNAGRKYDLPDQDCTELHWLLPEDDEETGGKRSVAEQNAAYVARWIDQQVKAGAELPVAGGGMEKVTYGDFTILLRTASGVAPLYEKALQELGIPVVNQNEGVSFFELPEVQSILAYLMVLNNPYDDVALVSLLYGDYFCFTVGELAAIRHRKRPLYEDLKLAADTNERAKAAYEAIEGYRTLSSTLCVYDLLHRIYRESGILVAYTPEAGGAEKCANLELLAENAREFERDGYRGLYAFVQQVRISKSKTMSGARLLSDPNAVKIMTIHKSKGLEFPICILGDVQKGFQKKDLSKPILLHPRYGAAAECADPDRFYCFTSLAQKVMKMRMLGDLVGEEERVLYVALTRAASKLVALINVDEKKMAQWFETGALLGAPLPQWFLKKHDACYAAWICALLADSEEGADLRLRFGYAGGRPSPLYATLKEVTAEEAEESTPPESEKPQFDRAAFRARLDWVYPHLAAAKLPAKLSVSELKGLREQDEDAEPMLQEDFKLAQPRFTNRFRPRGNEVGNALHQALQFCDFKQLAADPEEELARLVREGFILQKQKELISLDKIRAFTQSTAFTRLMAADYYCKEERFLFPMDAKALFGASAEGEVLIQGVIDCYGVNGKEAYLLDYKTDRVDDEQQLIGRYRVQMELYAEALKRVKGLTVTRREIYSFGLGKSIVL